MHWRRLSRGLCRVRRLRLLWEVMQWLGHSGSSSGFNFRAGIDRRGVFLCLRLLKLLSNSCNLSSWRVGRPLSGGWVVDRGVVNGRP